MAVLIRLMDIFTIVINGVHTMRTNVRVQSANKSIVFTCLLRRLKHTVQENRLQKKVYSRTRA